MTLDAAILFAHVLGAIVLAGTGAGIAFFMLMAHRSGDAAFIARTAATVTLADWLFTATAVVAQPLTGTWLAMSRGWSLDDGWLAWSVALYVLIGLLWLPVVAIQYRLKRLAQEAQDTGGVLSASLSRHVPPLVRARCAGLRRHPDPPLADAPEAVLVTPKRGQAPLHGSG